MDGEGSLEEPSLASNDAAAPTARHPRPDLRVRSLLRRLGLSPDRRLSQRFLIDAGAADAVVRAARVGKDDLVLEIGPGLGVLTRRLVRSARHVVAVELDARLAAALPEFTGHPANLTVIQGDILRVDLAPHLAGPYRLASNLPYAITSPVLHRFLLQEPRPLTLGLMLQREVAERITALPGNLSYLGVLVQLLSQPRIMRPVPASAFYPRPKVESAVVRLDVRERPAVEVDDVPAFLEFVRLGFTQPRKQLRNSLAQGLGVPATEAGARLARAGISPNRRPQELTLAEWATLWAVEREWARS